MKETGTTHWLSPNTGATNESGFSALPGGYRFHGGNYSNMGSDAHFWSSTEYIAYGTWCRTLYYSSSEIHRVHDFKYHGFSIRCVKD